MNIVIRADANEHIGQGHVMRCLSLADSLKEAGHVCVFACADKVGVSIVEKRGYECKFLNSDHSMMMWDVESTKALVRKTEAELIIIDSYHVSNEYFNAFKGLCKVVYFDDVYSFAYDVDCLINYNVYASKDKYDALYAKDGVKAPEFILGPSFAPLRKEFQREISGAEGSNGKDLFGKEVSRELSENTSLSDGVLSDNNLEKTVMISVGGADPLHLALRLVKKIKEDEKLVKFRFNFVLGRMIKDILEIMNIASETSNIKTFVDIKDMKGMIESSDLVVSAAGSTQYEICACAKPCICFSMADNQVEGAKKFDELGAFKYAGDVRNNESFCDDLINTIKTLVTNSELLAEMSRKAGEITDGMGAKRTVNKLEEILGR